MAAGVALPQMRFGAFRDAFCACARTLLPPERLQPSLILDAEITLRDIGIDLLRCHDALQPFGCGNPQPMFFTRGITLGAEPARLKEKHLSLVLRQNGREQRAIWFAAARDDLPALPWDVAFEVERNEYEGFVTPQIHIRSVRTAEP